MKNFHNIGSLSLNAHSSKGTDIAAESRFSALLRSWISWQKKDEGMIALAVF